MQNDYDKLDGLFGTNAKNFAEPEKGGATAKQPAVRSGATAKQPAVKASATSRQPVIKESATAKQPRVKKDSGRIPAVKNDPKDESNLERTGKHAVTERDYKPIRSRRDGKIGCLGGLMYFVFVVSLSVILACLAWLAATDVLALNKPEIVASVVLPKEIFTEKEVQVTKEDGTVTTDKVDYADIDYVARALKDAGIIQYKTLFKLYCGVSHAERKLDPGTYELNSVFDYRALVKKMQTGSGAMVTTEVTFPEGFTMEQIFARLEENDVCDADDLREAAANYVYNYSFLNDLPTGNASRLEGYLFPDTYDFYQGMQASGAINKFLENFYYKLTAEMYTWANNLGISLHDAVIIASMIEAEAANNDERTIIASVIYNRLAADMPLQIDATVMYALGEHKEYLTTEDTQVQSPYNTYVNPGLPAGPISNPGMASLTAALKPEQTNYYYYALDTATGTHRFFASKADFESFVATQDYTA